MRVRAALTVFLLFPFAAITQELPVAAKARLDATLSAPFAGSPKVVLLALPSVGITSLGLTSDRLQALSELVLRRNRIETLSITDNSPRNSGMLLIYATASPSVGSHYKYLIDVRYSETVFPIRQILEKTNTDAAKNGLSGILWSRNENGDIEKTTAVKNISDLIEEILNDFALAYLRANPR